ncbi:MAG: hypothetical protein PHS44_00515 [Candidatus Dojkabacteria bacterium]|nr:hypothetical protein [Candidatus Dojkabacteria bacterium]
MKNRVFFVIVNLLIFWLVTDLFSGIVIKEGFVGYLVCGGLYGIVMVNVVPLIKFFTFPIKFISILLISLMLSIIVFFILNFGIPFIDFTDGEIIGFSSRYISIADIELSMIGNVIVGGLVSGLFSALMRLLEKDI